MRRSCCCWTASCARIARSSGSWSRIHRPNRLRRLLLRAADGARKKQRRRPSRPENSPPKNGDANPREQPTASPRQFHPRQPRSPPKRLRRPLPPHLLPLNQLPPSPLPPNPFRPNTRLPRRPGKSPLLRRPRRPRRRPLRPRRRPRPKKLRPKSPCQRRRPKPWPKRARRNNFRRILTARDSTGTAQRRRRAKVSPRIPCKTEYHAKAEYPCKSAVGAQEFSPPRRRAHASRKGWVALQNRGAP